MCWSAPKAILASEPNVLTAINGAGQAITLRPSPGAPTLQLATARGPVRDAPLTVKVAGYNHPAVAIADDGALAAVWDTLSFTGQGVDRIVLALGRSSVHRRTVRCFPPGVTSSTTNRSSRPRPGPPSWYGTR